jgi:ABC-type transporter Mla MlaB component
MSARLLAEGAGRWRVEGALKLDTVPGLVARAADFTGAPAVLDVSTVREFDTSALALLLEWRRRVHAGGGRLRIENLPAGLRELARAGGVEEVLSD